MARLLVRRLREGTGRAARRRRTRLLGRVHHAVAGVRKTAQAPKPLSASRADDGRRSAAEAREGGFGGAYLNRAASLDQARAIAFTDPVHTSGSSLVTVYEWNAT
ncbi:MAG: hypothetical protein H6678_15295 [Candidatus Delongbacteria bacterium]|nr:hypothetical protein [Candidatus Delongbacteria bacterium]